MSKMREVAERRGPGFRCPKWVSGTALPLLLSAWAGWIGCTGADNADGASGGEGTRADANPAVVQDSGGQAGAKAESASAAVDGRTRILVAGIEVMAEVADEPAERERGLMFRNSVPDDQGMLFVYPVERTLSFWMKNTLVPLDIAFLDASGRIVDIQHMEANTEDTHDSRRPAMYALEMRSGWFEDHGVKVGDAVQF
ncbi:MAG: DUF192 domain-containing protein [Gemmatimonadota bacterium]